MSVSLLLGLVYLISELLLTYSTSSKQAPTRRSRTRFFASGASHSDTAIAVFSSCIVSGLRCIREKWSFPEHRVLICSWQS